MSIRIASTAYALPAGSERVEAVLARESERVAAALRPLSEAMRRRVLQDMGLERVRVCGEEQPYALALRAATAALAEAALRPDELDLVVDFTTLPGLDGQYLSFAQKLSAELGAETALNLSFRVGGCAGLHLAFKTATAMMAKDEALNTALLVAGDSPPPGSRSLFPITVQGDAASAVVLRKGGDSGGPILLGTKVLTLGHLHDVIAIRRDGTGAGEVAIEVDSARIERELMPVYYLNFYRLVNECLQEASLALGDIDYFVYSNISRTDRNGFVRALRIPEERVFSAGMAEHGHTFASDLVINYTELRRAKRVEPGQHLLFASAGIGFTWGVTLARA